MIERISFSSEQATSRNVYDHFSSNPASVLRAPRIKRMAVGSSQNHLNSISLRPRAKPRCFFVSVAKPLSVYEKIPPNLRTSSPVTPSQKTPSTSILSNLLPIIAVHTELKRLSLRLFSAASITNGSESLILLGQYLTKPQIEWPRFPIVRLPIPTGEIKLVYNSYQENGLPVVSEDNLVPVQYDSRPISNHLITGVIVKLGDEESDNTSSLVSSVIMTPAITPDCEALVIAPVKGLSTLDLGPAMLAADINDREMVEYTTAEETWKMPMSPTREFKVYR